MRFNISNTAKQLGISQGFLSNILAGRRRPHYKKAKDLAERSGVPVEIWMEGDPDQIREILAGQKQSA
jgi:transcriptional regulator with XRE-family HTH domain